MGGLLEDDARGGMPTGAWVGSGVGMMRIHWPNKITGVEHEETAKSNAMDADINLLTGEFLLDRTGMSKVSETIMPLIALEEAFGADLGGMLLSDLERQIEMRERDLSFLVAVRGRKMAERRVETVKQ